MIYLLIAFRATEHKSTKFSPNLMMLGRELTFHLTLLCESPLIMATENNLKSHEIAHKIFKKSANRQMSDHNKNAKKRDIFIGKFVWRWYPPRANLKLGLGWTGPYLIIQKITDLT